MNTLRHVHWFGLITYESMTPVFEQIKELVRQDEGRSVTLYLASEGGSLDAAVAFHDLVRHECKWSDKLRVHVLGEASSAALVVLMAADTRSASPNTIFTFHAVERIVYGDTVMSIAHAKEMREVMLTKQEMVERIIADCIGRSRTAVQHEIRTFAAERVTLVRDAAIELGIINE